MQSGTTRVTGSATTPVEIEADYEETSRQRGTARVSTSTKLPEMNKVKPPPEALIRIVNSMGEQSEQMSIKMSDLERAVHVERESQREEKNCNRRT